MAASDWAEIYRSYSPEELATEIVELKKQKSVFSSQQIGSKSYTKDLQMLQSQLQAAIRVQNGRKAPEGEFSGVVDFSGVNSN